MARIAADCSGRRSDAISAVALDLFRDLQFSLQPRFHLEIGLLKMVQAGRLMSIEEALASIGIGATAATGSEACAAPLMAKPPRGAPTPPAPVVTAVPSRH